MKSSGLLYITICVLLAVPAFGTMPTISSVSAEATSHSTIRVHWMTDITATTRIKFGTASGMYGTCPNAPGCWNRKASSGAEFVRRHGMQISGLTANTTYYLVACSTNGADEACSSEQTVTTAALPSPYPGLPIAPAAVDALATSSGSTLTVGSDCLDASTGLQAQLNAASGGDIVELPVTTVNCAGQFTLPSKAGTNTVTLRCAGVTQAAPEGTRTDPVFEHCKIYMTVLSAAYSTSITGTWTDLDDGNACVMNSVVKPGTYVYRQFVSAWSLRKCTYKAATVNVTNATNASPIVVTTDGAHGISNNQTICVSGVTGNTNANGCWIAKNVTGTTAELYLHDGSTSRAGNTAYGSGGIVRGMEWKAVATAYASSGRPSGGCTANTWGHDTSAMYFDHGVYRCKADGSGWVRVQFWGSDALSTDGNAAARNAAIVAKNSADYWRIQGIEFAPPPFDYDTEFNIGPRAVGNTNTVSGQQLAGILEFGTNVSHIELDRVLLNLDPLQWTMHTAIGDIGLARKVTHFTLKNSYLAGVGMWTQAAHRFEGERQSIGLDLTGGTGPFLVDNNYLEIYGFCFYFQEDGGLAGTVGNLKFTRNTCTKQLKYMDGGSEYNTAGYTAKLWGRQATELKNGQRVELTGNVLENQWVDQSRAAAFGGFGAQYGAISGTWSSGTFTQSENKPPFAGIEVGDTILDLTNNAIYTVDDVSSLPTSFHVSGSPPNGAASACLAKGNDYGVRDIKVDSNLFKNGPIGLVTFGMPYAGYIDSCYPVPHQRLGVSNNVFLLNGQLASATAAGSAASTSPWALSEGQEAVMSHNSVYPLADDGSFGILAVHFSEDTTERQAWKFDSFTAKDNIYGFGSLAAIWRHGSTVGTAALDAQFPSSYDAAPNVFMRSAGDPGTYPGSNYWETSWANVGYANPGGTDLVDYRLTSGSHRAGQANDASDGTDLGADIDAALDAMGRVRDTDSTGGAGSVTVTYTAPDTRACSVDLSDDDFATWTREADAGGAASREVEFTGLDAGDYKWRVLCYYRQADAEGMQTASASGVLPGPRVTGSPRMTGAPRQ